LRSVIINYYKKGFSMTTRIVYLLSAVLLISCSNTINLAVPTAFKEQATRYSVAGTNKNKMDFTIYKTSKIKRGLQVSYPGWGRGFIMENQLLNLVGLQKTEIVRNEKGKFRFSLSDDQSHADIFGKEWEMTRGIDYKLNRSRSLFNSYEQAQEYKYAFSALIHLSKPATKETWELLITNIYERSKDPNPKIFTAIKPDDNGIVTNGIDSFFIKGITIRDTETDKGKKGRLPFAILGGYEVRTSDGVAAIVDVMGSNVWFYNALNSDDKFIISAIAAAIFARRVKDVAW